MIFHENSAFLHVGHPTWSQIKGCYQKRYQQTWFFSLFSASINSWIDIIDLHIVSSTETRLSTQLQKCSKSFLCWMMSQEIADVSYATDEDKSRDGGDDLQYFPPRKAIVNSWQMWLKKCRKQWQQRKSISLWDQEPAFFILWNTQTPTDFIEVTFAVSKNKKQKILTNFPTCLYKIAFRSMLLYNDPECDKNK